MVCEWWASVGAAGGGQQVESEMARPPLREFPFIVSKIGNGGVSSSRDGTWSSGDPDSSPPQLWSRGWQGGSRK